MDESRFSISVPELYSKLGTACLAAGIVRYLCGPVA